MRMMLRATFDTARANEAVRDGTLRNVLVATREMLKPEAVFYLAENGERQMLMFFDMADTSQIPQIAEPLFQACHALVEFIPVMNADELQRGLEAWGKAAGSARS